MADETANLEKIANVLAVLLTKDMNGTETAVLLDSCGFGAKEIARLVGTSENSVFAMLSNARKKTTNKKPTAKKQPAVG